MAALPLGNWISADGSPEGSMKFALVGIEIAWHLPLVTHLRLFSNSRQVLLGRSQLASYPSLKSSVKKPKTTFKCSTLAHGAGSAMENVLGGLSLLLI
jgi:hypothetical protein